MLDPALLYCLLGSFCLLFVFAFIDKKRDPEAFRQTLSDYRILPAWLVTPVGLTIGWVELLSACLLITMAHRTGAVIGLLLLGAYTLAIAVNLARGRRHIDCGCPGAAGEGIGPYHLCRNLAMTALLAATLLPVAPRELVWLDYATIILWLPAAALLYLAVSLLIDNHNHRQLWWGS